MLERFIVEAERGGDGGGLLLIDPVVPVAADVAEVVLLFFIPVGERSLVDVEDESELFAGLGLGNAVVEKRDCFVGLAVEPWGVAGWLGAVVIVEELRLELAEVGRLGGRDKAHGRLRAERDGEGEGSCESGEIARFHGRPIDEDYRAAGKAVRKYWVRML